MGTIFEQNKWFWRVFSLGLVLFSSGVFAQDANQLYENDRRILNQLRDQELRKQQEKVDAQEQKINQVRPVKADDPNLQKPALYTIEKPCFVISDVLLIGKEKDRLEFDFVLRALFGNPETDPRGRCIAGKGIGIVVKTLQNEVIRQGYSTTRFSVENQDLKTGILRISVEGGFVGRIRFENPASAGLSELGLRNAVVLNPGDYLNARAIEQSVENLRRSPSIDATIDIVPTDQVGESDLVVKFLQDRPIRFFISLDDSGSPSTGKDQASLTGSYDNLWMLSDQLSITWSKGVGGTEQGGARGNSGLNVSYSIPIEYWNFSLVQSDSPFYQEVFATNPYIYSGTSNSTDFRVTRLLYRDTVRRVSSYLKIWRRVSENYIDDTKIDNQERRRAGWDLGVTYRDIFWEDTSLDLTLAYRRGTTWFGSLRDGQDGNTLDGTQSVLFKMVTLDATIDKPFEVLKTPLQLNSTWKLQKLIGTPYSQEFFIIGGRTSVRGFNDSLAAEQGWYTRNDVSWSVPDRRSSIYVGWDYGQVFGPSTSNYAYKSLSSLTFGVKANVWGVNAEVFVSKATLRPVTFQDSGVVGGFSLSYQF